MVSLKHSIHLLAYPNRIGSTINDLYTFMTKNLDDCIGGLHLLPFYPSNADSGFSPLTHTEVDPAFGTWNDIEKISATYDLCVDLTLNHISDESEEFRDFLEKGAKSKHANLFVHLHKLGEFTPDDMAKIHIRKEKEPFREVQLKNGKTTFVWSTFTEHQIDLNYNHQETFDLMKRYMKFLTQKGVKLFRLDAFGYITKTRGTSCFLVEPKIYEHLEWFRKNANAYGAAILPEVHDHPSYQRAISQRGAYCYAFALPPLILYSLLDNNSTYLKNWLRTCPHQQITVLDTHDGICIPDVEDLLPEDKVSHMVKNVSERSADPILRRSAANAHSVGAIYQLTCTFYDALKRNDDAYIAARAIQFFTPGLPQVYYVGLLTGENDIELMDETQEIRAINRHSFTVAEAEKDLKKKVVKRLLRLMKFRNNYPAFFDGKFELHYSNDSSVVMSWSKKNHMCRLEVDLIFNKATIIYSDKETNKNKKIVL